MRLRVDLDRCSGHARCYSLSEEIFPLDDVGYSAANDEEVPAGGESIAREGALTCPEGAIAVIGDC
jgi:ferredoxin